MTIDEGNIAEHEASCGDSENPVLEESSALENSAPTNTISHRRLSSCSCPRSLAVILHIIILTTAILCMIPMGVMTSVIRSYMSGVITLVWLIYCCSMVTSNIVAVVLNRFRKNNGGANEADEHAESRMLVSCNQMGCLCVAPPSAQSSCLKVPCPLVVAMLLVIEGILLLVPVFASTSSYNSLNSGAIDEVFPGGSSLAPNPRATSFSFGQYMLPGLFSYSGGYTNDSGFTKTLKYKDGCKPECELDIHLPHGEKSSSSGGYPFIFHVHGGGWDYGDKSAPLIPISYWLNRNYAFVSIQYRFPSQTPGGTTIFEQLDDVEDAYNYITSIGFDEGLDVSRVLFFGDSAGGHLACTVAYRSGASEVKGVMNLYGATEWEYYMSSGGGSLESLFEKVLPENPSNDDYRNASCSTYATPNSAPIITVHGNWDTLVPSRVSEHLHSTVSTLGIPNLLIEVPMAEHVLEAGFYSIGGQMSVYAMERFAAAQLLG